MPRPNANGDYLMGVAGVPTSLNDVLLPPYAANPDLRGGNWDWIDSNTIGGQAYTDSSNQIPPQLFSAVYPWTTLVPLEKNPLGANTFYARGGQWGASMLGSPLITRTSFGYRSATAQIKAMGDDGSAIVSEYQVGRNFQIVATDGRVQSVQTGALGNVCYREAIVLYFDFDRQLLVAFGADTPAQVTAGNDFAFSSLTAGGRWLSYFCAHLGALVTHPWGSTIGYVLSSDQRDYRNNCVGLPNGLLRVLSSTTDGEGAGTARVYDLDVTTGAGTLNGTPRTWPLVDIANGQPAQRAIQLAVSTPGIQVDGTLAPVIQTGGSDPQPAVASSAGAASVAPGVSGVSAAGNPFAPVTVVSGARPSNPMVLVLALLGAAVLLAL